MYLLYSRSILIVLVFFLSLGIIFINLSLRQEIPAAGIQGKTVVIDPGHGGYDTGIIYANKVKEKDLTIEVARKLGKLLKLEGANVKFTRSDDYLSRLKRLFKKNELDQRIRIANKEKADIFISLHVDYSQQINRAGSVVYYHAQDPLSQWLAQYIQTELRNIPEMVKRTTSTRGYYLLNHLEIPAVVVELGYLSNKKESERLLDCDYRQQIAQAIARGVLNYLNSPKEFFKDASSQNMSKTATDVLSNPEYTRTENTCEQKLKEKARLALEQLMDGEDKVDKFSFNMPGGFAVKNVDITGSLVTVDLTATDTKLTTISAEIEWLTISSICRIFSAFPEIKQIQLLVNNQRQKTLAGHIDISQTLSSENSKDKEGLKIGKKAKVAIVIDDFGPYFADGARDILDIDRPLTVAVMPNLENSVKHAKEAANKGFEVIVHLPMQPNTGKASWLGPGAITSDMTTEEIRQQVRKNFAQIPYATGFNNHMGSLITSQERLVGPVMEIAKEKGFFVLDSLTSSKSKMKQEAARLGIPFLQRDIFLDDIKSIEHVKKQLELLTEIALTNGSAIAIGHVGLGGEKTAAAIKEMIPVMEAKGIEFVYLSDLI